MAEYGRTLREPENCWWDAVEVTRTGNGEERALHIVAPLWTEEEGRSDLILELRLVEIAPDAYDTEIEDLHVL